MPSIIRVRSRYQIQHILTQNTMMKTLPLLFLLLIVLSSSSPCSSDQCLGYDPQTASFAAQYATCSNLLTHYKDQLINWTYLPCTKAQSKQHITDIKVITNDDHYLLAYFAYDTQRKMIVLAFRGTVCGNSYANAKTDINFLPVIFTNGDIGGGCKWLSRCFVHQGFHKSYKRLRDEVRNTAVSMVRKYRNDNPKFLVTGISLGGAIAAHASYDLALYMKHINEEVDFVFYTFGQPRIGSKNFAKQVDSEITIFRIVHDADPVPHLPPRKVALARFYNPGIEVYIDSLSDSQPEICNGDGEDCSLNQEPHQLCDHLEYPKINYKKGSSCKVNTCQSDSDISESNAKEEFNNLVKFLTDSCKKLCEDGTVPTCVSNYPKELQCSPEDQSKFLLEDMLDVIESPISESIKISSEEGKTGKSALCYLPVCKSGSIFGDEDEEEL